MTMKQTAKVKAERFQKLGGRKEGTAWIAWKFVRWEDGAGRPPTQGGPLRYRVGKALRDTRQADPRPYQSCAAGLNVHAQQPPSRKLKAISRSFESEIVLLECRVRAGDVACLPDDAHKWGADDSSTGITTGPKFRVQELFVVAAYRYSPSAASGMEVIEMAKGYELIPGIVRPPRGRPI